MVTIQTDRGEFTGRTVESIVRREYGRDAVLVHVDNSRVGPNHSQIVNLDNTPNGVLYLGDVYSVGE